MNERFDFTDRSIADIVAHSSSPYELEDNDEANIDLINDYIDNEKYVNRNSANAHKEYLSHLINRLANIKREQSEFFPSSVSLDMQISRLVGIQRRLDEVAMQ